MKDTQSYDIPLELTGPEKESIRMVVSFEVIGDKLVHVRGLNRSGDEAYDVSFVVRSRHAPNGCYVCLNPPCPPSPLVF